MYDINFPTSFMKLYFPIKSQQTPKHTPALGNKFPWLGYELGNFKKIPNLGTGYFFLWPFPALVKADFAERRSVFAFFSATAAMVVD